MNAASTDRVVDMKLQVKELDYDYYEDTGYCTDHYGTCCVNCVASCRDGYKTCEGCVETHGDIGLTVLDPGEDQSNYCCNCGSDSRCHEDRCELRSACCCRTVEAVPSEPEDEASECADNDVVT